MFCKRQRAGQPDGTIQTEQAHGMDLSLAKKENGKPSFYYRQFTASASLLASQTYLIFTNSRKVIAVLLVATAEKESAK